MDSDRVRSLTSNCRAHEGTADTNQHIQLSFPAQDWFCSDSSFPMQEVLAKAKKY